MREVRIEIAINRKASRVFPAGTLIGLRIGKLGLDAFEAIGVIGFVEIAIVRLKTL